jgi:hypothetical protein
VDATGSFETSLSETASVYAVSISSKQRRLQLMSGKPERGFLTSAGCAGFGV